MRIDVITIFPEYFAGPLDYGILRRARETGLLDVRLTDLREFAEGKHRNVDDRPFGGGAGMVLKPEPLFAAVDSLKLSATRSTVVLMSAQGPLFTQATAERFAKLEQLILICGRYEGVDERVAEALADEELSVGDFVLSGGDAAAAIVIDATTRLLPGALGNEESAPQDSFSADGILDYPHYTRPAVFRDLAAPEVLLSGHHEAVRRWRRKKALEKTLLHRPELLDAFLRRNENAADRELLTELFEERRKQQ